MDRHIANHARDKAFRCPSCRFTHRDSSVFVDHLVKHLPRTKIIQCCFCSFKAMPFMMKSHILHHSPTERVDCSECEYCTNSIESMTDHIEVYHTKKHACPVCSKVLTKYSLTKHINKVHKSSKPTTVSSKNGNHLKKTIVIRPGLTIVPVTRRAKTLQLGKESARTPNIPTMLPVVELERCRVPPECWKSLETSRKTLVGQTATRSGIRKSLDQMTENSEPTDAGSDLSDAEQTSILQGLLEVPKGKQIRKPIYFPNLVAEFGDTLLTCSICDYQTRKEHLLKSHIARHNDDLPFVCRKCDFKHVSVYEFANHMIAHEGSVNDDVYSCCFCNFWTRKKHNIPIHLDRHRGAVKEFDCPECEEVLTCKTDLHNHFDKFHCQALDCQFCGKNMTKFELNAHIKEHANEIVEMNHQPSESAHDQPGPSGVETQSAEIPVKPSNPLRNTKCKPKPLSRNKLDPKSNSGHDNKKTRIIEDETSKPTTARYKPKPLSKKEPQKTPIKTQPESNVPNVSVGTKIVTSRAKLQPKPLSKKILPKSDGKDKPTVRTGSDSAKKRERSPTPTKAKAELPKRDSGKDLDCRYCDYKTQISSLMDRHREKHKADTPFKCTKCKYETLSSAKISWHYLYHFPSDEVFPCPYCTFKSKNRMSLPGHIERHRTVKFFDCSKCQFSANNAHGVKKHFERMHVDKYSCTICDKVMTKHAMMKHLKKRHPSVYNGPAVLTSEVSAYTKHYVNYMRPLNVGSDEQKGKCPKPSTKEKVGHDGSDSAGTASSIQQPGSSQDVSGIKAAQQALAREIFGDVSDSDDGTPKLSNSEPSPIILVTSKPVIKPIVKSEDSDDSDTDSDTVIPKLSCPKCDFTTNRIADIKSHYRDMHEIEYACKLCRGSSSLTKYELLSHFKKSHPAISPEYYGSNMNCCTLEKPSEHRPAVTVESEESDDSDDDVTCTVKSVLVNRTEKSVPVPSPAPESSGVSDGLSFREDVKLERKSTEETRAPVLMDTEVTAVVSGQHPNYAVPLSTGTSKPLDSIRIPESTSSSEIVDSTVGCDDVMELDDTAGKEVASMASSSSEPLIVRPLEKIPVRTTTVEAETRQQEVFDMETGIVDGNPGMRSKCKECSFQTSRLSLLQRHSVKHKVGVPLVCPQCHFQNNSPYEFSLHWTNHFPDQMAVRCCFCAFSAVSKLDLALHFCVHNHTRVFDCDECDYSTSTKAFFEGHIWNIHKKVTCQKCQDSMPKTELPNHTCIAAIDDDVLNSSDCDHKAVAVSGAKESVPGETLCAEPSPEMRLTIGKCGTTLDSNDSGKERSTEGSAGKQIIARESFKTSELRKFSFLRKRDFPCSDAVFTTRSPEESVAEEPSPVFEPLSADSSFSEVESGNVGLAVDGTSKTKKPERSSVTQVFDAKVNSGVTKLKDLPETPLHSRLSMGSSAAKITEPPVDAEASDPSREGSSNVGEKHDEKSYSVAESNDGGESYAEKDSKIETVVPENRESFVDRKFPSGEPSQPLPQESSFIAEGSFSGVPIIDISGSHEIPEQPAQSALLKRPSTSWTEPIESDDDDEDGNDHNYFGRRRSKSPVADLSPRSDPRQSSPVRSEDFPGDFATEVVFDNGMTALVMEVSDGSEEEL